MKALFLLAGCLLAAALHADPRPLVPRQYLVIFNEFPRTTGKADPRDAAHRAHGAQRLKRLDAINADLIEIPTNMDEDSVVAAYGSDVRVALIEPNGIVSKAAPNDAIYDDGFQLWYDQIQATQAFDAWVGGQIVLQTQVTVAVIDTGSGPHSELSTQLLPSANFVANESSADLDGHGTFVAGIIAASVSNTAGMAGVFFDSSKIRILPVKVLNASGQGTDESVASGIIYAAAQGARVLNLSLGENYKSETVRSAVNVARRSGACIVAAAGNGYGQAVLFPAGFPNVIAVSAVDGSGMLTPYSNFGRIDISGPGGLTGGWPGCLSWPNASTQTAAIWSLCPGGSTYRYAAGTSFAAPMVAAAAALLLSQNSSRSAEDLYRILTQSADPTPYGPGYHPQTGWGRLNVYKALTYSGGNRPGDFGGRIKAYNWPNPFNPDREGLTNLTFYLEVPGATRVHVRDMAGELVFEKHLGSGETVTGMNIVSWNGRNSTGRVVANGTYLLSVECSGKRGSNRVMVLR